MRVSVFLHSGAVIDVPAKDLKVARAMAERFALKGLFVESLDGGSYVLPGQIAAVRVTGKGE